jgi:osmotically inducible lipoprotein OsmB
MLANVRQLRRGDARRLQAASAWPNERFVPQFVAVAVADGKTRQKPPVSPRGKPMKTIRRVRFSALAAAVLFGLAACADMVALDKDTSIDAGADAIGVENLPDGSSVGTVGGAPVGGVIGHDVGKK